MRVNVMPFGGWEEGAQPFLLNLNLRLPNVFWLLKLILQLM